MNSLKEDIAKLLEDEECCDGTLVAANGATIPVHKQILAARSGYFKAAFFGRLASSSDTVKLEFEEGVVTRIKSYCYTDVVDPIFGAADTADTSRGYLSDDDDDDDNDSLIKEEDLAMRGRFLLQLATAADYLLLPGGLKRKLWQVAYNVMMSRNYNKLVPIIYGESKNSCGCKELEKLAWHTYWLSQESKNWAQEMNKIETDICFEAKDPNNATYKNNGVMLLMGCSEEAVNGEYLYDDGIGGYQKIKQEEETAESGDMRVFRHFSRYDAGYYNNVHRFLDDKTTVMYRSFNKIDQRLFTSQWTMDMAHKETVGSQTPPICFLFR